MKINGEQKNKKKRKKKQKKNEEEDEETIPDFGQCPLVNAEYQRRVERRQ